MLKLYFYACTLFIATVELSTEKTRIWIDFSYFG